MVRDNVATGDLMEYTTRIDTNVGCSMEYVLLSLEEFLSVLDNSLPNIFKIFISKYDWKNAYNYVSIDHSVSVSDFTSLFSDGKKKHEATIMYEHRSKWIRVTKLKEKERVSFLKALKKQKSRYWEKVYG